MRGFVTRAGEMPSLGERYRKSGDLVTRQVTDETVIVPVRGRVGDLSSIFVLNEVGTVIWAKLSEEPTFASVVDAVRAEFSVSEQDAARDAAEFLDALEQAGLVERLGGSEG